MPVSDQQAAPHPTLEKWFENEPARKQFVRQLFDDGAEHYSRITDLMSFGSGQFYRRDALLRAGFTPGMDVLDVACGTGQVSRELARLEGSIDRLVALDPSTGMLRETRSTLPVRLVQSVGESLPFQDGSFDFLSMGYALRHVPDLLQTFREYHRALRPDGRVVILEITRPANPLLYFTTRFYMQAVVPCLARIFTPGADQMMSYYWDTIQHCVPPDRILTALTNAGFKDVKRHVVFGIFSEYTGTK